MKLKNENRKSIGVYIADVDISKDTTTEKDKEDFKALTELEETLKATKKTIGRVINKNVLFRCLFFEGLGIENEDINELHNIVKEKLKDESFILKFNQYQRRENSKKAKINELLEQLDQAIKDQTKAMNSEDFETAKELNATISELQKAVNDINNKITNKTFKKAL